MTSQNILWWDYLVIAVYILGIFFLAFMSGRKTLQMDDSKDLIYEQYLAGKSLTFWESMASIIATEVSALTFLGIPAFAYGKDFSFIQIYMGALFGRIVIAFIFLPRIYNRGLTVYSTMAEENGTKNGQRFTAVFYFINKILAVGVRLFSGSILVAEFFNLSIYTAVFIICVITFFYTLIGGLKAVVRTDMVQMGLFILGGLVAHYIIPDVDGRSWGELITIASEADKTSFFQWSNPWPFVTGVIGGILFDMATHGVDQDFAQRLTANHSLKSAQKAIITSTFLSIAVGLLFLSIGALLWSHYQTFTPPGISNDKLFAYFITEHFPTGLKGLMVAGVLAATMSTLDSTINALSACFYNDIIHHRTHEKHKVSTFYKRDTLIITLMLMIIAFIASTSDGLLVFGLKITSWTAGSLLALFFSAVIWQKWMKTRLDAKAVFGAYFFGIAGVYLNNNVLAWPWQWNVYFGFVFAIIYLTLLPKLAFSRPHEHSA
jgi:SSS family solute:Na+ symporter